MSAQLQVPRYAGSCVPCLLRLGVSGPRFWKTHDRRPFASWIDLGLGATTGSQVYTHLIVDTLHSASALGKLGLGVGAAAAGAMLGCGLAVIGPLILTEV